MSGTSTRATTGAIAAVATLTTLMIPVPAAIGWATYAHSRPKSEWTCNIRRDTILLGELSGEVASITTCTVYGVTVSRTLSTEA